MTYFITYDGIIIFDISYYDVDQNIFYYNLIRIYAINQTYIYDLYILLLPYLLIYTVFNHIILPS